MASSDHTSKSSPLAAPFHWLATVLFWGALSVFGLICGILAVLCWPLAVMDRRRRAPSWISCLWGWLTTLPLRFTGLWSVRFDGWENVPADFSGVIAPNHLSQLDILVLHSSFLRARWVSKESVFRVPVIGWAMRSAGYVSLRRDDQKSIRAMTRRCASGLDAGVPLVIFPEGTRSKTGSLQPFKNGAFLIAKMAKKPILPVAIEGTWQACPPGGRLIRAGVRIRVRFLPVISASEVESLGTAELAERCYAAIAQSLGEPTQMKPASDAAATPTHPGTDQQISDRTESARP